MYKYENEKKNIFTENGVDMFISIRDEVRNLLKQAGAVSMACAISRVTGDSWTKMACVDRLVEVGEIREITQENVAG